MCNAARQSPAERGSALPMNWNPGGNTVAFLTLQAESLKAIGAF